MVYRRILSSVFYFSRLIVLYYAWVIACCSFLNIPIIMIMKNNTSNIFYAEVNADGSTEINLNNKETYTITLPPDEDLLEKNEKIEDDKITVNLRYKWDAIINIVYNSDHKIVSFNSQNTKLCFQIKKKPLVLNITLEKTLSRLVNKSCKVISGNFGKTLKIFLLRNMS